MRYIYSCEDNIESLYKYLCKHYPRRELKLCKFPVLVKSHYGIWRYEVISGRQKYEIYLKIIHWTWFKTRYRDKKYTNLDFQISQPIRNCEEKFSCLSLIINEIKRTWSLCMDFKLSSIWKLSGANSVPHDISFQCIKNIPSNSGIEFLRFHRKVVGFD